MNNIVCPSCDNKSGKCISEVPTEKLVGEVVIPYIAEVIKCETCGGEWTRPKEFKKDIGKE